MVVVNALALYTFMTTTSLRTRKHIMIINLIYSHRPFFWSCRNVINFVLPTETIRYCFLCLTNIKYFSQSGITFYTWSNSRGANACHRLAHTSPCSWNKYLQSRLVFIWVFAAVMITFEILVLDEHGDKMSVHLFVVFLTVVIFGVITGIVACYISIWISVRRRRRHKLSAPNKQDKALALPLCW